MQSISNVVKKGLILLCILPLFQGCALHQGYLMNSAALSSNNFSYVKKGLSGSASATYVFGLGGNTPIALVDEAKNNMLSGYAESLLKDNRALVNLTVNWKNTLVLPFVVVNKCTVTADLVEFK